MSVRCSKQRWDTVEHEPLNYNGVEVESEERSMAAKLLQSSGNRDKIGAPRQAEFASGWVKHRFAL